MKSDTNNNHIDSYDRLSQAFHWLTAGLVLIMIPLGLTMARLSEESPLLVLYRIHVAIGLIVLLLTLTRVAWMFRRRQPVPLTMPPWRRVAFRVVNVGLYLGLIAIPVSGIAMLIGSGMIPLPLYVVPDQIEDIPQRVAHRTLAWILTAIVLSHFVGIISYQMKKGDTFSRMLPKRFSVS